MQVTIRVASISFIPPVAENSSKQRKTILKGFCGIDARQEICYGTLVRSPVAGRKVPTIQETSVNSTSSNTSTTKKIKSYVSSASIFLNSVKDDLTSEKRLKASTFIHFCNRYT